MEGAGRAGRQRWIRMASALADDRRARPHPFQRSAETKSLMPRMKAAASASIAWRWETDPLTGTRFVPLTSVRGRPMAELIREAIDEF